MLSCRPPAMILLALALSPAVAAEVVEHPTYSSWAGFPKGTTVVLRSITGNEDGTGRITTTTRQTLIELDEEKIVVEEVITTDSSGEELEYPPRQSTLRRLFPLLPGVKKEDVGKPSDAIASGEETLEAAGRTLRTRWFDSKGRVEAGETLTRTWMSDEVPGRVVRSVTRVPAVKSRTTLELIEIRSP